MILHIINSSPFTHNSLNRCMACLNPSDSLLLIEDAVLLLTNPTAIKLISQPVYALKEDCQARGLRITQDHPVAAVDYTGFVDLVAQHDKTLSWF